LPYAGRAGTGITDKELKRLAGALKPLAWPRFPSPRDSRFGSPLKLSKVHWVKPELVVEVTYLPRVIDIVVPRLAWIEQVVRSIPYLPRRR